MNGVAPDFGWMLVCFLLGISGAILGWAQFFNSRRSQRRDVAMVEEFATRKELEALANRVEEKFEILRTEIQQDKLEMMKASETRVVKVHDRINDVLSAVSELRGEVHSTRRGI